MTEQMPPTPNLPESPAPQSPTPRRRNGGLVWGAILILIGVFALVEQVFHLDFGLFFLPLLGIIFLAAGILDRRFGLLIPGGILVGLGAGTLLVEGPFKYLENQASSGVFMLAFAGGWLLITFTSLLIGRAMLWPLIPGAFLGLLGVALIGARTGLLNAVSLGWPIILIAIGLYLVLRRRELTK